ncbi:MAG: hypothetical protein JNK58_13660 [Phycisphaerae bacterium]|nr:hypothetical protein [Phycisphaerae bacterium]
MQPGAPITHGSRMDHFYAVDTVNGYTYVGHCEQTAQTVGLLNLIHYGVFHTSEILAKQQVEGREFGVIATEMYLAAHSKTANVALAGESRVAIHILDGILRQVERQGAGSA